MILFLFGSSGSWAAMGGLVGFLIAPLFIYIVDFWWPKHKRHELTAELLPRPNPCPSLRPLLWHVVCSCGRSGRLYATEAEAWADSDELHDDHVSPRRLVTPAA